MSNVLSIQEIKAKSFKGLSEDLDGEFYPIYDIDKTIALARQGFMPEQGIPPLIMPEHCVACIHSLCFANQGVYGCNRHSVFLGHPEDCPLFEKRPESYLTTSTD